MRNNFNEKEKKLISDNINLINNYILEKIEDKVITIEIRIPHEYYEITLFCFGKSKNYEPHIRLIVDRRTFYFTEDAISQHLTENEKKYYSYPYDFGYLIIQNWQSIIKPKFINELKKRESEELNLNFFKI